MKPEASNLSDLSALHLAGPIKHYKAIETMRNLRELTVVFGNESEDLWFPVPEPPLFSSGALSRLSWLQINSGNELDFETELIKVNALSWKAVELHAGTLLCPE